MIMRKTFLLWAALAFPVFASAQTRSSVDANNLYRDANPILDITPIHDLTKPLEMP